jgi:hypothetical protein
MRKLILPIALVSASFAFALDVEFHGDVNFDYGSYFDSSFSPTNAANQDIDLSAKAKLDENVSVTVFANTHSTYVDSSDGLTKASETRRHYYAHSTAINDGGKYTEFNFNGVELRWDVANSISLVFGDLTYSAGAFNYYYWRDPARYAAIVREQYMRGAGIEVGNEKYGSGKVYMGASENNEHSMALFGSYSYPLLNHVDQHLVLTPSVDWLFGKEISRSYTYTFGLEVDYTRSYEKLNYGVYAVWGVHPYKGKGVHSFLVEPTFNYDFFNLSANFFYAITDEDYAAADQILTEDQLMFAIEPSFNLHKKFALGVGYEYHDRDTNVDKDSYHYLGLNAYLYPTLKTELVFWAGYNFSKQIDTDFAMGVSAKASF